MPRLRGARLDVTPAQSPRLCRRLSLSPDPMITLHLDEIPDPNAPGMFWGAMRRDRTVNVCLTEASARRYSEIGLVRGCAGCSWCAPQCEHRHGRSVPLNADLGSRAGGP